MGKQRKEGRKKKQNAVFLSIVLLYLAHTAVAVYKLPLSSLISLAYDSKTAVDIDENEAMCYKIGLRCRRTCLDTLGSSSIYFCSMGISVLRPAFTWRMEGANTAS